MISLRRARNALLDRPEPTDKEKGATTKIEKEAL